MGTGNVAKFEVKQRSSYEAEHVSIPYIVNLVKN